MEGEVSYLSQILPPILTTLVFIAVYYVARILLDRQAKGKTDQGIVKSIFLFLVALVGTISVILSLPLGEQKDDITSLIGIVLSAVLGLSSITFIGNALAGILLRSLRSFKLGDFITINEVFGRVSGPRLPYEKEKKKRQSIMKLLEKQAAQNDQRLSLASCDRTAHIAWPSARIMTGCAECSVLSQAGSRPESVPR